MKRDGARVNTFAETFSRSRNIAQKKNGPKGPLT
jgi:hypothetical protein